ncbi:hypothetical protein ACFY5F_43135, partial [Streptomyces sp. NPDC013161]
MTENKALKKAIRKRMAATGEPYNTARRNVLAEHEATVNLSTRETGVAHIHRVVKSPSAGPWVGIDTAKLMGGARIDVA